MPTMTSEILKTPCSNAGTNVKIEAIESVSELCQYRDQIDALSNIPFLKTAWMFPWIETFCGSRVQLKFVIALNSEAELIGFAPLVLRRSMKKGKRFCFVGSGKACADYMTFPVSPQYKQVFLRCFSEWLIANRNDWDRLELDGAVDGDPTFQELTTLLKDLDCRVTTMPTPDSWRLDLPDSWEELLGTLSKNSRKKYRRLNRSLEGKAELHRATDADSFRQGFRIFEKLHTARWESLGEEGCFGHEGFGEFLRGTAKEHLESNSLSLIWLTIDGQPIAADIAFYNDTGAFTYQGGISPEYLDLEPGRAILKSQIESAIERRCQFIDFLRGDEPYKARFNATGIKNSRLEIAAPTTRARMIDSMLRIGRLVKSSLE